MAKPNEAMMTAICKIQHERDCSFFEATLIMADELDKDILELLPAMDANIIARLRESAIEDRMIPPSMIAEFQKVDITAFV